MHKVFTQKTASLEEICTHAIDNNISHVWVTPKLSFDAIDFQGFDIKPYYLPDGSMASLVGRKVMPYGSMSQRFNVIFLAHSGWNWKEHSPTKVCELIKLLESRLGITLTGSSSNAGLGYLEVLLKEKHPKWLAHPESDLSVFSFKKPLVWHRIPTEEELSKKYLYSVDKNSAFPRVGKAEKFGYGEPIHTDGRDFDAKLPGMWKIEVTGMPDFDERLPHPLHRIDGLEWLPTAIVKLLISTGCKIEVKEAWVFEQTAFIFKEWAENLWAFRSEYSDGTPERSSIKKVLNNALGMLASEKVKGTWKYRPDWYAQIVSCARAVMYYNIYKYAKEGYYPVHCQNDELMYLSDEEDFENVVPGLLDNKDSLGGYKLSFKIPLDAVYEGQTIREIVSSKMSPGLKKQAYNAIGEK